MAIHWIIFLFVNSSNGDNEMVFVWEKHAPKPCNNYFDFLVLLLEDNNDILR